MTPTPPRGRALPRAPRAGRGPVLLALALAAFAGRPAAGQDAPPDSLLGRWEFVGVVDAEGRPDDAAGLVAFTFSADGVLTVERTAAAVKEDPDVPKRVPYRVEGRRLALQFGDDDGYGAFQFEGDTLVIRDEETGDTATLRRPAR